MKRFLSLALAAMLLITACGCSGGGGNASSETENAVESESLDCEDVIRILKDSIIPMSYYIVYDDETDPNILEHGEEANTAYVQKANFADERYEEEYDPMEPSSGTVEIFPDQETALERANVLNESGADVFAIRILAGNILVRLSANYSEEQAQEIADALNGTIHSVDKDYALKSKFGDSLEIYQGEWVRQDDENSRAIINDDTVNFVRDYEISGKQYRNVNTFYFNFDENGVLVISNSYEQPRYNIDLGADEVLTITAISDSSDIRSYTKSSDNTEVPSEIKDPEIGMSEGAVLNSTWGTPSKINKTTTASGEREQWVYDYGYIYLENGYVVAIQER